MPQMVLEHPTTLPPLPQEIPKNPPELEAPPTTVVAAKTRAGASNATNDPVMRVIDFICDKYDTLWLRYDFESG